MDKISLDAYGKINIGLDVLSTLPNGYHEVKMIMQTVSLHDTVTIEKTADGIFTMECDNQSLPADSDNLCMKAVKLLDDEFSLNQGVHITLEKRIPIAAGMAGGSTDAAAVLKGINQLFELGLTDEQLEERSVVLGADIPYCIKGGTALSEGIGEKLSRIHPMMNVVVLIAKPAFGVSTKEVYKAFDSCESIVHPDIDGLVEAIEADDIVAICNKMGNVLADVTEPMHPEIKTIKNIMIEGGAINAMMTGSGPTVFGFFENKKIAEMAKQAIEATGICEQVEICNIQGEGKV